jgi:hypothetical protein
MNAAGNHAKVVFPLRGEIDVHLILPHQKLSATHSAGGNRHGFLNLIVNLESLVFFVDDSAVNSSVDLRA